MTKNIRLVLVALLLAASAGAAQAACTTGQTTCTTDTTAAAPIVSAITDTTTGVRVYNHWNQACDSVYAEAATTTGHYLPNGTGREPMCLGISAGHVPNSTLVALIMNPLLQSEIIGCTIQGQAAGCLVDVDIDSAIAAALVVTANVASTTGTAASGVNALTVASATGISVGQTVIGPGVSPGTTVLNVSGTTVTISNQSTGALSATPLFFYLYTGLPTRPW